MDGGRAVMPMPKHGTKEVPREQHAIAHAVNILDALDEYLKPLGLYRRVATTLRTRSVYPFPFSNGVTTPSTSITGDLIVSMPKAR
ncbi:MAG: hypothetical protein WDO13_18330 [Verrucomicrobiota bacterium]